MTPATYVAVSKQRSKETENAGLSYIYFFSDNLGGSLLIPTRGFRSHGGTTSSHPFLIESFHYKPSMFILGHPQPFSNTPKRKRNVQPQMRSSKGDQTWVSGRSSYRWIPCEKNGEDDFPSNSSMISPDENLVVTTSWRFSMIATELMLGWAVFLQLRGISQK